MVDNENKASKGHRFLKKSKWGKIFREDAPESVQRQDTFKLNDDVVDFLKPSTEKSVPKIDIAIAKRWPDAQEVRSSAESPLPQYKYTKPKRRKGLTVTFVKTLPEIIGEGGDESLEPPREISRQKAVVQRSLSDRRPGSHEFGRHGPRPPPLDSKVKAPGPGPDPDEEENFVPPPFRRTQTAHGEPSTMIQRKQVTPLPDELVPYRPSLGRMPTGRGEPGQHFQYASPLSSPVDERNAMLQYPQLKIQPTIDTQPRGPIDSSNSSQTQPSFLQGPSSQSLLSHTAISPSIQKRREMTRNEGLAFRRASMIMQQGDEEEENSPSPIAHLPPPQQTQMSQLVPGGTQRLGVTSLENPDSIVSPVSPDEPSPFADPKYMKQYSQETSRKMLPYQAQSRVLSSPAADAQGESNLSQQTDSRRSQPQKASLPIKSRSQAQSVQVPVESKQTTAQNLAPHATQQFVHLPSEEYATSRSMLARQDDSPRQQLLQTTTRPFDTRDEIHDSSAMIDRSQHFMRPNGSSSSNDQLSLHNVHSRTSSREGKSPQKMQSSGLGAQQRASPQAVERAYSDSKDENSGAALLGLARTELYSRSNGSQGDIFSSNKSAQTHLPRTIVGQFQSGNPGRPRSSCMNQSTIRSPASPLPVDGESPAAAAAFADFAGRAAHMKAVFRLTAEKERPSDHCTPIMWLRAGLWWYLTGKSGLEALLQQRGPSQQHREILNQAHVDLAKAWWILCDPLAPFDTIGGPKSEGASLEQSADSILPLGVSTLRVHLHSSSLVMLRQSMLPPKQSLIQGQNTRIWHEYPRFKPEVAAELGGNHDISILMEDDIKIKNPLDMLPLNDTQDNFCYGRFPAEVSINTDESETDRINLPCMLTVLRGRKEYQTSIVLASQSELVNIRVTPRRTDKKTLDWANVSWKASTFGMSLRLAHNLNLNVRMQERDFRAVWSLSEYARTVERNLRAGPDERLVHEARLAQLQYSDSSNTSSFPQDKIDGCMALIFERTTPYTDGSGMRRLHRGYRVSLMTDTGHKTLSSASHEVCRTSPLYFEFLTDAAAGGTTAMVIRVREESRQFRILMVFSDTAKRQDLFDVLSGLMVDPDETIVCKINLTSLEIESEIQSGSSVPSAVSVLQTLQWQKLGVTNGGPADPNSRIPSTVESEHLRLLARHVAGCFTDRLNLSKGELLVRMPATNLRIMQILRPPQEDLSMSLDTRNVPQATSDGIAHLLRIIQQQTTVRTFTFPSHDDLHTFQAAITGFTVRYDGLASTLGISRRRMVVPIYKKWEASNVRIQIVAKFAVVQLLAFMEDFGHADALCFQVKSTDTFESIKGDGKHKKCGVKLVDAKFSLPSQERGEASEGDKLKRRFVNLEGLDYAEEHDDITVTFETEQERDKFAQALPAATSVSRGLTLKRRI